MARIEDVLSKRTDLSTFLVHLTRDDENGTAKEKLKSIILDGKIKRGEPMGPAVSEVDSQADLETQKTVCLTETPLHNVKFLIGDIEARNVEFEPYGIAITKSKGREEGVNPVWYVDITPGHDWLMGPINELIEGANRERKGFGNHPISKITPFIEQMGTGTRSGDGGRYRKEFWWEREWRSTSDLWLDNNFIILCPEVDMTEIQNHVDSQDVLMDVEMIDPRWSLEKIIASLANLELEDIPIPGH